MIRRPPRSTLDRSSAASDVYKRQVIDSTTDVQVGVYSTKLLTGYIGAVGGYIPQQIRRFVFERNGYYFVVTLYALGLHVTEGEISQIAQLNPEDVSLFDNIVASLQFP